MSTITPVPSHAAQAAKPPANAQAAHGRMPANASQTAIIVCNLGTPDAPTASAVRRYLAEFLADPRVVEIPRAVWLPILHGIILRTRPAKSAAKYQSIWLPAPQAASPLLHYTQLQAQGLQAALGHTAQVYTAMRYGNPALPAVLNQARADGAKRLFLLPLYPQYSGTTTASVFDSATAWLKTQRNAPDLRWLSRFHDDEGYINALAAQVRNYWAAHGRAQKLLLSFHGVPERTLHLGDPYHCECLKTARLLAQALQLESHEWQVSFQSRFGKAKWVDPATETTLQALPGQGITHVDVFCPGFVADCLETLEEIALEGKETFLHAGGQQYRYIPCLNDSPQWLQALTTMVRTQCADWLALPPAHAAEAAAQAQRVAAYQQQLAASTVR